MTSRIVGAGKSALKSAPSETNKKTNKRSLRFNREEQETEKDLKIRVHRDGRKVTRCSTADNDKKKLMSGNARMKETLTVVRRQGTAVCHVTLRETRLDRTFPAVEPLGTNARFRMI